VAARVPGSARLVAGIFVATAAPPLPGSAAAGHQRFDGLKDDPPVDAAAAAAAAGAALFSHPVGSFTTSAACGMGAGAGATTAAAAVLFPPRPPGRAGTSQPTADAAEHGAGQARPGAGGPVEVGVSGMLPCPSAPAATAPARAPSERSAAPAPRAPLLPHPPTLGPFWR